MVNFDWYYPKYAWRQTEEEIKHWCEELNLKIQYIKEIPDILAWYKNN